MSTTPTASALRRTDRFRRYPLATRVGVMVGGFVLLAPLAALSQDGFTLTATEVPGAATVPTVVASPRAGAVPATSPAKTDSVTKSTSTKRSTTKRSTTKRRTTKRRTVRRTVTHVTKPVAKPAAKPVVTTVAKPAVKPVVTTVAEPPATTAKPVVATTPTTVKPVAPAPAKVVVAVPLTKAQIVALIQGTFPPEQVAKAMVVVNRESTFTPTAYNGICCYGLFQINYNANKAFLATLGVTSASQLYDAATNIRIAFSMWQRSGWGPWGG
jgi:hypothetical protein